MPKVYDPSEVYQEHVHGKVLIYLDNMVWIEFADQEKSAKNDFITEVLEACKAAKSTQKVLFPISWASIHEVNNNKNLNAKLAQARIMDKLSDGVIFRNSDIIYNKELDSSIVWLLTGIYYPLELNKIFSYPIDFISDFSIDPYKESFLAKEIAQWQTHHVKKFLPLRSLEYLLDSGLLQEIQKNYDESKENYERNMKNTLLNNPKPNDFQMALRKEYSQVLKEKIFPEFEKFSKELLVIGKLDLEKYKESKSNLEECIMGKNWSWLCNFMSKMPALNLFCHFMANRTRNSEKKVTFNDFYDVEHACSAAAYADYIVTENHVADLLENVFKTVKKKVKVIRAGKLEDLTSVCQSLTN